MNQEKKRANLDSANIVLISRGHLAIALVTMLIAASTVVGNFFIGNERSERNAEAIGALTVQVQALTTSQAVIVNNNTHQDQEISEIKLDVDRLANKAHNKEGSK
jgi:hypothetical protein